MGVAVALSVIGLAAALLIAPLRIGLVGHMSLALGKAEMDLTVIGLRALRLRCGLKEGRLYLKLNGKKPKKPKKEISAKQIAAIGGYLKPKGELSLIYGDSDALKAATVCAGLYAVLAPLFAGRCGIFAEAGECGLEADFRLGFKLNLLDALWLALNIRSVYGS